MHPLVFFTIISRNYLAYALTLMQSVARQYPDAPRYLCLADERADDPALATDLFQTVTIDALNLPSFDAFVFRYDIMELNTAVKPYMFEWLRQRHADVGLVYLDPDLYVQRPFDDVQQAFASGKLAVLTPHLNHPLADDGKRPDERWLLRTGAYNCGFVAINAAHPASTRLIDWWSRKLEFDCYVDLEAGLFTDQKWMDMAPSLFPDIAILRHDGYNVAYWNLANRTIARAADGGYTSNGTPLVFAHFSGVDLSRPGIYSKHQNRFNAETLGGLRPLYDEYLGKLRVNGDAEHKRKPYAYGRFSNGKTIVPALRRAYRHAFDVDSPRPEAHPQHMDRTRFNAPCHALADVPGLPISCVMYEAWRMRPDLRDAYTLQTRAGRALFIERYLAQIATEMGLDEEYTEPIRVRYAARERQPAGGLKAAAGGMTLRMMGWGKRHAGLARLYAHVPFRMRLAFRHRVHTAADVPMPPVPFEFEEKRAEDIKPAAQAEHGGVNLLGYARGEFGIAQNVRSYARALERVGHPFCVFNLSVGVISRQEDHSVDGFFSDSLRYATNVFFINADQLPVVRSLLGRRAFSGRHNVGFFLWELEKFPAPWRSAFALVDEVWVPTGFVRTAVMAATRKPVRRMPKAIEFDVPAGTDRAHFGLPADEFLFLFSYDFNSFIARKNPDAVIVAFRRAFADGRRGVRLVIKSTNGTRFPEQLAALRHEVADDVRIEVRDGFLSRDEMFGLENAVDCYVSLHRSEGFGLGMAESMYLGKPVIATGYSGNLDFMDEDNSLLVDYKLVPVRDGEYPHWQGQRWADADVDHAARLMRQVFDDRELARRVGGAAAASIRRTNSKAVCGAALVARLAELDQVQ